MQEALVDKKLQIIRMALRGDAPPIPSDDYKTNRVDNPLDDYLSEANTNDDVRSSAAAAAAAIYCKNQAFFN
jgi:hypothetical protein